jgi:hypothetical protein
LPVGGRHHEGVVPPAGDVVVVGAVEDVVEVGAVEDVVEVSVEDVVVVVSVEDVLGVGSVFRSRPVAHRRSSDVLSLLVTESQLPAHAT